MGTSEFAVPSLKKLIDRNFDLIGVVTQPDRPSGRRKRLTPPPVKVVAQEANLPIYQPEQVRHQDFIRTLKGLNPHAHCRRRLWSDTPQADTQSTAVWMY